MGVESSSYRLTIMAPPETAVELDTEYLLFQLRKQVPNAKSYLNEDGKPSGQAGYWDTLAEDLKPFSLKHPEILFRIDERYQYETTVETRHFVQNGKAVNIEQVLTWPEFSPEMLV